jgi:predicted nucleic acid-binding protein
MKTVKLEVELPDSLARDVRNADDDQVLSCAVAATAHLVVSGDDDLLALETFGSIRIVSVSSAVQAVRSTQRPPHA